MASGKWILIVLIVNTLAFKVTSVPYQPAVTQYLQVSALPNSRQPNSLPNPNPKPKPVVQKPLIQENPSGLNSNVLNNLAIALQLLIVSNILNSPAESKFDSPKLFDSPRFDSHKLYDSLKLYDSRFDSLKLHDSPRFDSLKLYDSPKFETLKLLESLAKVESPKYEPKLPMTPLTYGYSPAGKLESYVKPQNMYYFEGLSSPNLIPSDPIRPNPRSNMMLMSPYEALGPNSPFSDPILSSAYSPSFSKSDFVSPYASILGADSSMDMFNVADLF